MSITKKWGDGAHLTRALFAQDKIWVTADSMILVINEMKSTHVLNTLLMIERLPDLPVDDVQGTPLYTAMMRRLVYLLKLGEAAQTEHAAEGEQEPLASFGDLLVFFEDHDEPKRAADIEAGGDFVMPNRRIAVTRREILDLLRDLREHLLDGKREARFKMHYIREDGKQSTRIVLPFRIYDRPLLGSGLPEMYMEAIDLDIDETRNFRADRIQRLEEVPT